MLQSKSSPGHGAHVPASRLTKKLPAVPALWAGKTAGI